MAELNIRMGRNMGFHFVPVILVITNLLGIGRNK